MDSVDDIGIEEKTELTILHWQINMQLQLIDTGIKQVTGRQLPVVNQSNPHVLKANEDQFNLIADRITNLNNTLPFHRDCTGTLYHRSVQDIIASN